MEEQNKNKPRKFRKGNIIINEWTNEKDDKVFTSYTLQKIYKDKDQNWKSTDSFNKQDLSMLKDGLQEFFGLVKPLRLEE